MITCQFQFSRAKLLGLCHLPRRTHARNDDAKYASSGRWSQRHNVAAGQCLLEQTLALSTMAATMLIDCSRYNTRIDTHRLTKLSLTKYTPSVRCPARKVWITYATLINAADSYHNYSHAEFFIVSLTWDLLKLVEWHIMNTPSNAKCRRKLKLSHSNWYKNI